MAGNCSLVGDKAREVFPEKKKSERRTRLNGNLQESEQKRRVVFEEDVRWK